jgi:hypothetical protein
MIFALNGFTGTAPALQVSVFNGSQLLGSSFGPGPEFDFRAPAAPFGLATASPLDFSAFMDASIDGVVQVRPSNGFFDVPTEGVALVVGGWVLGSAVQTDSGYGAVITALSVSPVPEPGSAALLAVGLVAVLLRARRFKNGGLSA